ncbi:hypothetical protein K7X08_011548 [Anisodus acutangulus]|uniref:Carboxypeptidase A inhibitor-like domain-containing protein n=1 Tax=Anisodus acutangulus TaxID=402998 RepID=A0A9Q1MJS2_9SOLA|nr:hypothetical protein K7X08_011548 [Anisodus acutangulus]
MAQGDELPIATKRFQKESTCGHPCKTKDDCEGNWFCPECSIIRKTCRPFARGAIAPGDEVPIATKRVQKESTCGHPCKTKDDCKGDWFCPECSNFWKTCRPFAMAMAGM